jgi:hypothetical protein
MPRRSDTPEPGFYLLRLVKGGPWVGAEIRCQDGQWRVMVDGDWQGPVADPWSLPNLERVHWGGRTTTESEVRYRLARKRHAIIDAPNSPAANPRRPVDPDEFIPF